MSLSRCHTGRFAMEDTSDWQTGPLDQIN